MYVGVSFCQSYPPPCLSCSSTHSTYVLPPPSSPLLPPLRLSSSLIYSQLISLVIIHCVVSFLSALQSGRCACLCPLCSRYDVFIYLSTCTCTDMHTQRHTDRPFLCLYFSLGSQTPIKAVFDFPLLLLPRPHMPQRGGGRGRVDTWCPLSLRTVNLPGEVGRWGGGWVYLLAGSCLSSKLFISVEKLRVCEDLCKQTSTRFWNKTKQTKGRNCQKANWQKSKQDICLLEVGLRSEHARCETTDNSRCVTCTDVVMFCALLLGLVSNSG